MTATVDNTGGVSLADLAGDFGEDELTRTNPTETETESEAESGEQGEDQPTGETSEQPPEQQDRPRRRGPRPASEHVNTATERLTSSDGVAGWRSPSLGEAVAEQNEAIYQWRTKWWTIPRSVQAVAYLAVLSALIGCTRLLARTRYMLTALVLAGGAWGLWAWWGVGV